MFTNKEFEGIYYSRFIASWVKKKGKITWEFQEWLKSLTINGKRIPDDVIQDIYNLGTCGKLELETSAMKFIPVKSE